MARTLQNGADDTGDEGRKRVVLVTGCAKGGIGFEYCLCFVEAGCRVYATDVPANMEKMAELRELGVTTLEMDVRDEESVRRGVARVAGEAGGVDVVVNNAGVGATGPLAELPVEEVARTLDVNVLGALRVVQAVAPLMAAAGGGIVVNIGSVTSWAATPWAGAYCASKAALQALTDALRVELRPFKIHTVLVMPGAIRSNLGAANTAALSRHRWSLYAPFSSSILDRASASQSPSSTPARLLAIEVVRAALSPNPPPRLVFGYMTTLFRILSFSPIWLRDLFMTTRFGLSNSAFLVSKKTT